MTLRLDATDTEFVVTFSPLERGIVASVNGLTASGSGCKTAHLSWNVYVDAASTVERFGGEITDAAKDAGTRLAGRAKLAIECKYRSIEETATLGEYTLFQGQIADADWLHDVGGRGFLFSDLRTGKTLTIAYFLYLMDGAFPALLACPPHITFELERQFRAALPERRIVVLSNGMTGTQRKKALESNPEIVIMGYNLLAKHSKVLNFGGLSKAKRDKEITQGLRNPKELNAIGFKTVILDEAHNVKDPTSQQTRAVWALGDAATYRIAATGTPTSKRETGFADDAIDVAELWALLRFVYPEDFPAKSKFWDKYLHIVPNFFGIMEVHGLNPENKRFWNMVFEPMYLRRKRTIKTEKDIRVLPVELESKQRRVYNQLDKHSMADVGGSLLSAEDALTLRQRKLQASLATLVLDEAGGVVGMQQPSAVLDALLGWMGESEEKGIIFSHSKIFFKLLEQTFTDQGVSFVSFPGGLSNQAKLDVLNAFRDNPAIQFILVSVQAGNAGIDLSAATRMAFASLPDDSTMFLQALDRNQGPTQEAAVTEVALFIPKDTVVEEIHAMLQAKQSNLRKLFKENHD